MLRKALDIDTEAFDDELVLMKLDTRKVLVLNGAGRILWEAMDAFPDRAELLGMLIEAMPNLNPEEAAAAFADMLRQLSEHGFLRIEPDAP